MKGDFKIRTITILAALLCMLFSMSMEVKADETAYVRITHYCACKKCCGRHATGHFASGHKVRVGGVAANRYALGTVIYIVELDRYVVVTDRSDPKYANRIDIYTPTHGGDVQIDYAHIKVVSRSCATWSRSRQIRYSCVSRGFCLRDKLSKERWYAVQELKRQKLIAQAKPKTIKVAVNTSVTKKDATIKPKVAPTWRKEVEKQPTPQKCVAEVKKATETKKMIVVKKNDGEILPHSFVESRRTDDNNKVVKQLAMVVIGMLGFFALGKTTVLK